MQLKKGNDDDESCKKLFVESTQRDHSKRRYMQPAPGAVNLKQFDQVNLI